MAALVRYHRHHPWAKAGRAGPAHVVLATGWCAGGHALGEATTAADRAAVQFVVRAGGRAHLPGGGQTLECSRSRATRRSCRTCSWAWTCRCTGTGGTRGTGRSSCGSSASRRSADDERRRADEEHRRAERLAAPLLRPGIDPEPEW